MLIFQMTGFDFILVLVIFLALTFDLTKRRIPNFLTFPAIIIGLFSNTIVDGLSGLWFSFAGLLVGLAIFFIPFVIGAMGAGDVKLMAAIGALQGWQFVLTVGILTALAGGVIALGYLIYSGRLFRVLKKMAGFVLAPFFSTLYYNLKLEIFNKISIFFANHSSEVKQQMRIPYGAAIAIGVIMFLVLNLFPWGETYIHSFPWL